MKEPFWEAQSPRSIGAARPRAARGGATGPGRCCQVGSGENHGGSTPAQTLARCPPARLYLVGPAVLSPPAGQPALPRLASRWRHQTARAPRSEASRWRARGSRPGR